MLGGLAAAIEGLELAADGDELAAALRLRDLLDAKLAEAVAAFDGAELWDADGATSMVGWLADRAGMARREATRVTRRARLVRRLPATAAAWHEGRLSTGQVDAICANLTADLAGVFARHEADLLPTLVDLPAADVAAAMRAWRACAEDAAPPDPTPQTLHASRLLDGRLAVDGTLDAETGELLLTALRVASAGEADDEPPRGTATRRADALGDICRFFLDHQRSHRGGRHRPHVNLVVHLGRDGDVRRAATVGGVALDRVSAGRLLCDSVLHRVLVQGRSAIVDYGRATRAVPPPLWNVTVLRDRHCRFPGCDRPPEWCEAHHVVPWERGGPTNADNLVLLCSRHHHVLHRPGWAAVLRPDGTLEVTDPQGCTRATRPPPTGPPHQLGLAIPAGPPARRRAGRLTGRPARPQRDPVVEPP
ncbi:MAG: DUF222 domain-containing protein [Thermoanaerobacterales bacterium]|mgnify:FL=1|nr:HNH endonuclease [Thermoanaerobacterales bacterium]